MNLQLKNLTLAQKLAALSLIFMAPILLLSWLLVAQSRKDIDFAALEMDGSHYLVTSVWPILHDLVGASVNPDSGVTTGGTAGIKALQGNQAAHDETMKSGEASAALREAYDKAVAGRSEDAYVEATAQARTLTGKVADGSNLTLDPDLDSYY